MTLVLVDDQSLAELDALTAWITSQGYTVGLYQGDPSVVHTATLSTIVPASFPGYSGLQPLVGWQPAVLSVSEARSYAAPVTWTHNGLAPVVQTIGGYYVVAPGPRLAWWERVAGGPVQMGPGTRALTVVPRRSHRSQSLSE